MSVLSKVGVFSVPTSAGGTLKVTTGFQPKAILFWWSKTTSTVDAAARGHIAQGFGFAASPTERYCISSQQEDNSASSDTDSLSQNDAVVVIPTITGAVDGLLDLQSLDVDGFTVVTDDAFTAAYSVSYLALGGDDITNVKVGSRTIPASTGYEDVTDLGFAPDVVFFLNSLPVAPGNTTNAAIAFGVAVDADHHWLWSGSSPTGLADMDTGSYLCSLDCVGRGDSASPADSMSRRAEYTLALSNGFRLLWNEAGTGEYHYLAIRGCRWTTGITTTRTDSTPWTVTTDWQPKAVLLVSHNNVQSTWDAIQANWHCSAGAFTSPTERCAQATLDRTGTAKSECFHAVEGDEVYINQASDGSVQGLMDVSAVTSTGFELVMDAPDPSVYAVAYVAVGDAYTGPPPDITGSGALSAATPSVAASGLQTFAGDGALSSATAGLSGAGSLDFAGAGNEAAPAPSFLSAGGLAFIGTGAQSPPAPSLSGVGELAFAGTASLAALAPSPAGEAVLAFAGQAAIGGPAAALVGLGSEVFAAAGALTPPAPSLAASATLTLEGAGALAVPFPSLAATGEVPVQGFAGDGGVITPAPGLAGAGLLIYGGDGAVTVPAPSMVASGVVQIEAVAGTGALTAPSPSIAGSALVTLAGDGAVTLPVPALSASGSVAFGGDGAVTAPAPTIGAAGLLGYLADGGLIVPVPTFSGAGSTFIPGVPIVHVSALVAALAGPVASVAVRSAPNAAVTAGTAPTAAISLVPAASATVSTDSPSAEVST